MTQYASTTRFTKLDAQSIQTIVSDLFPSLRCSVHKLDNITKDKILLVRNTDQQISYQINNVTEDSIDSIIKDIRDNYGTSR